MEFIEYKTVGIWEHFFREKAGQSAKCKICSTIVKATGGSTKGLHEHLKRIHGTNAMKRKNPEIATGWCYYWHTVFLRLRIDWTQWTETGYWIPGYYTVVCHEQSQTVWYYVFWTMLLKLALTANIFNTFLHGHCVKRGWAQSFPEFPLFPEFPGTIFQIPVSREFVYLWREWIPYVL